MKRLLESVSKLTQEELERSYEKFPAFNGPHEGYAVIQEEMDELKSDVDSTDSDIRWLWGRVKKNIPAATQAYAIKDAAMHAAAEAVQVAAMAQKYINSVGGEKQDEGA